MATYQNVSGDYNITTAGGNINVIGNVVSAGYVQASYYVGDGQFLTNVTANIGAASILQNGTSNVSIVSSGGPISFGVGGIGNIITVSETIANITATTSAISSTSGALRVAGGVGVVGNIYAGALYDNNVPVLNENSVISGGSY
jgi:hypothetical protein